jgi:hypothetical protein
MSSATVPQAVQACHELLLWFIPQLDKFPRARRFEAGLLGVLESLVKVGGKLSVSFLRREHFLQDSKNCCERSRSDSPNSFNKPFAIHRA